MIKRQIKAIVSLVLVATMAVGMSVTAFAAETQEDTQLQTAYENVMTYADEIGVELGMTYEDFVSDYNGQPVQDYEESFYSILVPSVSTYASVLEGKYYNDNSDESIAKASYGKYDLLNVVKKGDIVFEANGGFGVTGHIAIVEGIFLSGGKKYIQVIEAIPDGVKRGILDDTRFVEGDVSVLRVDYATTTQIRNVVKFCVGEIGSKYKLDIPAKDTSSAETDWYCSELVWAAYKGQGIDIANSSILVEPGVTPREIFMDFTTSTVKVSKK